MIGSANEQVLKKAGHRGRFFLGIDTGTSRDKKSNCGYAIVGVDGVVHDAGVWRLTRKSLNGRFSELRQLSAAYIKQLSFIIAAGIENPWIDPKNPQVGLTLAKTWGILAGICFRRGFYVCTVAPATAKIALTGNARASKKDVFEVAKLLWPDIQQFDESDAIAIATATRNMMIAKAMKEQVDG